MLKKFLSGEGFPSTERKNSHESKIFGVAISQLVTVYLWLSITITLLVAVILHVDNDPIHIDIAHMKVFWSRLFSSNIEQKHFHVLCQREWGHCRLHSTLSLFQVNFVCPSSSCVDSEICPLSRQKTFVPAYKCGVNWRGLLTFSCPGIWHLSRLRLVHVPLWVASFWPPQCSCVSFSSLLAPPTNFQALVTSNSTVHLSLPLSLLGHWSMQLDTFELNSMLRGDSCTDGVETLYSKLLHSWLQMTCLSSGSNVECWQITTVDSPLTHSVQWTLGAMGYWRVWDARVSHVM